MEYEAGPGLRGLVIVWLVQNFNQHTQPHIGWFSHPHLDEQDNITETPTIKYGSYFIADIFDDHVQMLSGCKCRLEPADPEFFPKLKRHIQARIDDQDAWVIRILTGESQLPTTC